MALSRRHEEVLERAATAFVLREQCYTLRYIAAQLEYRSENSVRHLLDVVHENEFERSAAYRNLCAKTRQKLVKNA